MPDEGRQLNAGLLQDYNVEGLGVDLADEKGLRLIIYLSLSRQLGIKYA